MAKYQNTVHCINFNSQDDVKKLLMFLKNNEAKVSAFDQSYSSNTFAILTKYRVKKEEK